MKARWRTLVLVFLAAGAVVFILAPYVHGITSGCGSGRGDLTVTVCAVDAAMNPMPYWALRIRCYNGKDEDDNCVDPYSEWVEGHTCASGCTTFITSLVNKHWRIQAAKCEEGEPIVDFCTEALPAGTDSFKVVVCDGPPLECALADPPEWP